MCIDILFLKEDHYEELKGMSLKQGLVLILLVSLIVGVAGFIGQTIKYANEPTFQEIENIWKEPMRKQQKDAPWYGAMPGEARREWDKWYDMGWEIAGGIFSFLNPSPAQAFIGIFTGVLGKILVWIFAGLILFACARILGGMGSLSQTLAAVSFGITPHLLEAVRVLPYVVTGGIFVWSCVIIAKGLRSVHGLSKGKSLLALILPALVILVLGFIIGVIL